ncbi:Conserved oligomeric Golgi complex subunit 2 [Lobosporangium transversale]|nr:Conserved oligomeric Golgi complex subunit 2 [Lobosporangium transversale]
MVASTGVADNIRSSRNTADQFPLSTPITTNGNAVGNVTHGKKPAHLSIDSTTANSAFIHTLNSQIQAAAKNSGSSNRPQQSQGASASGSDFSLTIGIDRAALIAPDFDTDEFLSARRHLPLEELKSQLISHMKELKTELIELINSDYADFINLSTNLNGVDRMMEDLRKPLDRMKGDTIIVRSNFQSVIDSLQQKLQHRTEIRERKASLQLLVNISESVAKVEGLLQISSTSEGSVVLRDGSGSPSDSISVAKRLERVAIEYNKLQYLVSKGADLPFVTSIDWRLARIKETMSENLSTVLRSCIKSSHRDEGGMLIKNESMSQCLRTYALIDQTAEAEKVITEELLVPFISKTITRAALTDSSRNQHAKSGQNQQRPLTIIYNQILTFIDSHCSTLLYITQKELKGTNFDIPVNCIWGITTQSILKNIPQILLPGIPDEFHRNYTDTMDFVSKIEELCGTHKSLARLRSQANYQAFMKRWQLPAYFQLRFREISLPVEDVLQMTADNSQRYSSNNGNSRSSSPAPGSGGSTSWQQTRTMPSAGGLLRPPSSASRASLEETTLQQLSMIVNDIDHVVTRVRGIFDQDIRPKLPVSIADEPTLTASFNQSLEAIRRDVPTVQQRITDLITRHCVDTLASVKSINVRASEGVPREPSQFVPLVLAPLSRYISGSGAVLNNKSRDAWAKEVIVTTTNQYSAILAERLLDIKLSEEATNKLKAAAKSRGGIMSRTPVLPNIFSTSTSEADPNMSTSDKLRLQFLIKFDIDPQTFQPFLDLRANVQPYESLLKNSSKQ